MKLCSTINILDDHEVTRFTLGPNNKYLATGGLSCNLYIFNMEKNDFEEEPDPSELNTGIQDLDWDCSNATRLATIDTTGVLTVHKRDIVTHM